MEVFINERSAHGQCPDRKSVNRVVAAFVQILHRMLGYQKRDQRWSGPELTLYQKMDIRAGCVLWREGPAGSLMSAISDKFIQEQLIEALGRLRPRLWTVTQQHLEEIEYTCQGGSENGTSLAELAERVFQQQDLPCFLVNFAESRFSGSKQIEIDRQGNTDPANTIVLDAVESFEMLEEWAAARHYIPCPYPMPSRYPPQDDQTILIDSARFERTKRIVQGRRVFRERDTGRLWYVDNLHTGARAELEVFDANGNHIGVANVDGAIDESRRKRDRHIDPL
jgi:hypothetical protein